MAGVILEGMGVVGSLVARHLAEREVEFNWFDKGRSISAWRACTGSVYPSGDAESEWAREQWRTMLPEYTETAPLVFCTKRPPHGGRYSWTEASCGLNVGDVESIHVNAQRLVEDTRRLLEPNKVWVVESSQMLPTYLVTHGWSWRRVDSLWGWSAPVRVERLDSTLPERACYYLKEGRFLTAYAYPRPGTDEYYAGSSMIPQVREHKLDAQSHFLAWRDRFERLARGGVRVEQIGPTVQGWRPRGAPGPMIALNPAPPHTYAIRPQGPNGVRHAPLYLRAVDQLLRPVGDQ